MAGHGRLQPQGLLQGVDGLIEAAFPHHRPASLLIHQGRTRPCHAHLLLDRLIEGVFLQSLLIGQQRLGPVLLSNELIASGHIVRPQRAAPREDQEAQHESMSDSISDHNPLLILLITKG